MDFFTMHSDILFDIIVSGEVLEHIENPGKFLRKLTTMANDNALIYITTVINAPAIDHISLFKNPDELRVLFDNNGLRIIDMRCFLYRGKPLEVCIRKKWPVMVAITAQKV